ncbi:MAG: WecB/TagA/CpsF family glycosyltransferase [Armatimonadetes bacterium]|nr:WecB/TagA/CpsF family glycosyltransferase [Armatimonadota bacterium]
MDTVSILGLPIRRVSTEQALAFVTDAIARRDRPRHIVTADASMAVIARRDPELRAIIAAADLVTPDGFGILWASRLLRTPITHKVSGVDLVGHVCRLSTECGWRVFFLGAAPGVAEEAAARLRAWYPGAQIVGTQDGYFTPDQEPDVLARIRAAAPDVLLVAFGIPKQEKWIARHRAELNIPISVGVGGSFDVYSGRVKRAPVWMQEHGWEWLHRLASNPKKIGKVMTLPEFVLLALRQRFLGAS